MQDLKIVKKILEAHFDLQQNKVFLFGSRALGTHRENSDLDLLIIDRNISPSTITKLEEAFEESELKFKVDIVLRSRIADEFFQKIEKDLKEL